MEIKKKWKIFYNYSSGKMKRNRNLQKLPEQNAPEQIFEKWKPKKNFFEIKIKNNQIRVTKKYIEERKIKSNKDIKSINT